MTTKNKLSDFYLAILLLLFTTSCDNSEGVTTRLARVIHNQSSFDIHFYVWNDSEVVISELLSPSSLLRYEGSEYADLFDGYFEGLGWLEADSIVVVQDSLKLRYLRPDSCVSRTPVQFSYGPFACYGYESELIEGVQVSTFTFTNADFADAEVIGD